jgi:hypothetical protein
MTDAILFAFRPRDNQRTASAGYTLGYGNYPNYADRATFELPEEESVESCTTYRYELVLGD